MGKFFRTRAFIAMCIIAAFLLGLALYSMTTRTHVSPLEDICGILITPLQKASNRLVSAAGNFKAVFTQYDELKNQNEALREKLNETEAKLRDAEQYVIENKSLREINHIVEQNEDIKLTMSHVTGSDLEGYNQTLTLDKGSLQGIALKDMVITGNGIVGYVSEVGASWCTVTTILDPACRVGVVLTRTQNAAILQGDVTLATAGLDKVSYLKNDVSLAVGDSIETSGIGGIFPKGLFVGRIKEIKSEATGLSQYAVIQPAADIRALDTVFIVTEFTGEDKEQK